jgi:ABC-type branched-subunit amino acid transport system permease subunit
MILASGVNIGPAIGLIMLMALTAVAALLVGWWALRPTPLYWARLIWAYALLVSPFWLATLSDGTEGFALAIEVALFSVITPLAGVVLTVLAVRKNRATEQSLKS